jgi:rhamnogalacturonan endolyase
VLSLAAVVYLASTAGSAFAQRQMEAIGRGAVAVRTGEASAFISWRLLGNDPDGVTFNVYRSVDGAAPQKANDRPLGGATCFVDDHAPAGKVRYSVRPVVDGRELAAADAIVSIDDPAKPYFAIPLDTPAGYHPNDVSVGDLDGDGEYDLVVKFENRTKDNSQSGETDPVILEGIKLDGTKLWRINLGPNIRGGAHYTQFMVYDLDSDGRAEVACKTADGTVDGAGKVIGDATAKWANERGYVLAGPEFLTVFDGRTGAAVSTVPYVPLRGVTKFDPTTDELKQIWGDGYGNRCDRFLACVAYLDGARPSLVMCRGYYTRTFLVAWDFKDGQLTRRWTFDSGDGTPGNEKFGGQGNHNLSVADVDGDGRDEIVYGGMVVDDDGKGLFSTGLGHGDAMHVSDLDPSRPGLEMFRIQERFDDAGAHLVSLATGEVLWRKPSLSKSDKGQGPGRGVAFDIDPRHPGAECWAAGAGVTGQFDVKGNLIFDAKLPVNMAVWWDGDDLRELLDGTRVTKWNWTTQTLDLILDAKSFGCVSNNGTKANPCLSADLLGDWREEVIWASDDGKELRLFTTTIPTQRRLVTLMHDPVYRLGVAWQNVAYNQPPHTGFFLGRDMKDPKTAPARYVSPARAR